MSGVKPDIQTAPEWRGFIRKLVLGTWTGTSTPEDNAGEYLGKTTGTLTVTIVDSGTVGSGSVEFTWAGLGVGGAANIGSSYTPGEWIHLEDGIEVRFDANTVVATETFTIAVVARRALPADYKIIPFTTGGVEPVVRSSTFRDRDHRMETESGKIRRAQRHRHRVLQLDLDWMDGSDRKKLLDMSHRRQLITVGENYGADTSFLWRGGDLQPMIGPRLSLTRATAAVEGWQTGLWSHVGADELRVTEGPVGPAAVMEPSTVNNLDTLFHPYGDGASERGWQDVVGTLAYRWDEDKPGVLDPNDGEWSAKFRRGTLRMDFDATEACETDNNWSISGANPYIFHLYVRGRGSFTAAVYSDNAGGGTPIDAQTGDATTTFEATDDGWTKITLLHYQSGSQTVANVRITCVVKGFLWVSAKGVSIGYQPPQVLETDGGATALLRDLITLDDYSRPSRGTLSMWVKWPTSPAMGTGGLCDLFREVGGGGGAQFAFGLRGNTGDLEFDLGVTTVTGNLNPTPGVWYHVGCTWDYAAVANSIGMKVFANGAVLATQLYSFAHPVDPATESYTIGDPSAGGYHDIHLADVRIDGHAWDDAEILEAYERGTEDAWIQVMRANGGRFFDLRSVQERMRGEHVPGQYIGSVNCEEGDWSEDGLMTLG